MVQDVDANAPWRERVRKDFPVFAFLAALHLVENPKDSQVPGPHGELGRYQFKESTWRDTTTLDFTQENVWLYDESVAVKHVRWLQAEFHRHGMEGNVRQMALAWKMGFTGFLKGPMTIHDWEYSSSVLVLTNMESSK